MKGGDRSGKGGSPTINKELEVNNSPGYSCPACDRPTLKATPNELTDFCCSVCSERVREVNA